jgi:hypothetical protein
MGRVGRGAQNIRSDVQVVQQLLNAHLPAGLARLKVDGIIGPKTLAALQDFQRVNVSGMSFAPTCIVAAGDPTWQKLTQPPRPAARVMLAVAVAQPAGAWPAKFTFEQFWDFTEPLEGGFAADCMFMVQDLQVATGMGITFTGKANRNAGLAEALALEWTNKNTGQRATAAEITRDYDIVLSMESVGRMGPGRLPKWKEATTCRITKEGLKSAVRKKIIGNLNHIRANPAVFGSFDEYPADAQLCCASLSWAIGINFETRYPSFCRACKIADWSVAALECTFKNQENTIPRRQAAQQLMMRNARACKLGYGNPNILHWPKELSIPDQVYPEEEGRRLGRSDLIIPIN